MPEAPARSRRVGAEAAGTRVRGRDSRRERGRAAAAARWAPRPLRPRLLVCWAAGDTPAMVSSRRRVGPLPAARARARKVALGRHGALDARGGARASPLNRRVRRARRRLSRRLPTPRELVDRARRAHHAALDGALRTALRQQRARGGRAPCAAWRRRCTGRDAAAGDGEERHDADGHARALVSDARMRAAARARPTLAALRGEPGPRDDDGGWSDRRAFRTAAARSPCGARARARVHHDSSGARADTAGPRATLASSSARREAARTR